MKKVSFTYALTYGEESKNLHVHTVEGADADRVNKMLQKQEIKSNSIVPVTFKSGTAGYINMINVAYITVSEV